MLIDYVLGQSGVVLRLKARQDNTGSRPGQGFTGLSNTTAGLVVSTIADAEAAATPYTVAGSTIDTIATLGVYAAPTTGHCRLREVDPTNHPGLIEIQLANSRFAVAGAKELTVTICGASGLADCDAKIPLRSVNPYDAQRFGLASLPVTGTLSVNPTLAAAQVYNNTGQTNNLPANATQFSGQSITASSPVTIPASIGTSTFSSGGSVNVSQIGGQSVSASAPVTVLASVGTASPSLAQSGDAFARLGSPTGSSIAADIQTRSTFSGLGATAPSGWINTAAFASGTTIPRVTLADTLTTYSGNTPQSGDAFARLGTPTGSSIAADIQTRSTYAGGAVTLSPSGLDAVSGWGSWSARQTIQAIAQVLFGTRSGMPSSGAAGTINFTGPGSASYGSVSVDTSGNVTSTNLTPPA